MPKNACFVHTLYEKMGIWDTELMTEPKEYKRKMKNLTYDINFSSVEWRKKFGSPKSQFFSGGLYERLAHKYH